MYCIVIYTKHESSTTSFEFIVEHVDAQALAHAKSEAARRVGGVFDVLVHGVFKL